MDKSEMLKNLGYTLLKIEGSYCFVKCDKCGFEFKREFSKFNSGTTSCAGCAENEKRDLLQQHGYTLLEIKGNDCIVKCSKCNKTFTRSFKNFKLGYTSCPECDKLEKEETAKKHGYTILEWLSGGNVKVQCNKCNNIFNKAYKNISSACPECTKLERETYIKSLGYEILSLKDGKYTVKCNKCGDTFTRSYDNFKSYKECPTCVKNDRKEYISSLGYDIISIEGDHCTVKCRKCNIIFKRDFSSFKRGAVDCPECMKKDKIDYLNSLGFTQFLKICLIT